MNNDEENNRKIYIIQIDVGKFSNTCIIKLYVITHPSFRIWCIAFIGTKRQPRNYTRRERI